MKISENLYKKQIISVSTKKIKVGIEPPPRQSKQFFFCGGFILTIDFLKVDTLINFFT